MPRAKVYESSAERQRAYRERKKVAAQNQQGSTVGLTQESTATETSAAADISPEPPSPPSENPEAPGFSAEPPSPPITSEELRSETSEVLGTSEVLRSSTASEEHGSSPSEELGMSDEPPGPGTWEWSQAYGWVEVEREVSYDVRTGIVVTEAGETREPVRDGWHGPAD